MQDTGAKSVQEGNGFLIHQLEMDIQRFVFKRYLFEIAFDIYAADNECCKKFPEHEEIYLGSFFSSYTTVMRRFPNPNARIASDLYLIANNHKHLP